MYSSILGVVIIWSDDMLARKRVHSRGWLAGAGEAARAVWRSIR